MKQPSSSNSSKTSKGTKKWDQKKLVKRADKYFSNVCSDDKVSRLTAVINTHTVKKLKRTLASEPLYLHFSKLYGKQNFNPFRYGNKFNYTFRNGKTVKTSTSQLMFWKWCMTYDILSKHYKFYKY